MVPRTSVVVAVTIWATHTFSPRIVNEARIAYNRDNYGFAPSNNGINVGQALSIAGETGIVGTSGGPLIGGCGNEIECTGDYGLFTVPQNTYEVTDTVNVKLGKHSLNAGGTFLRREVNFFRPISGKGFFFFAGNGTDFTGYETSEMLSAPADNYSIGAQTGYFGNESRERDSIQLPRIHQRYLRDDRTSKTGLSKFQPALASTGFE
jgi:hypothetical protein